MKECKGCKKKICSKYIGHRWYDLLGEEYCEKKFFNIRKEPTIDDLANQIYEKAKKKIIRKT